MIDRLQVILGGQRIGVRERPVGTTSVSHHLRFPDEVVTPLSVAMPPQQQRYTHSQGRLASRLKGVGRSRLHR